MSEVEAKTEEAPRAAKRWFQRVPSWFAAACIALVVAVLYLPTLSYDITNWDDQWLIDNKWLADFDSQSLGYVLDPWAPQDVREDLGNEYLPIRDLSYVASKPLNSLIEPFFSLPPGQSLSPNSPHAFRLVNVLLHAANAFLVFLLVAALTRRRALGLICALLFSVLPIHVESVVWLSSRKELLSAFFLLASLVLYVRARSIPFEQERPVDAARAPSQSRLYFGFALAAFLCALLSKTPALVLPGLLVAIELYRPSSFAKRETKRIVAGIVCFALIAILHFSLISYRLADNGLIRGPYGDSPTASLMTAFAAQGRYWAASLSGTLNIPAFDHPLIESPNLMMALGLIMTSLGGAALVFGLYLARSRVSVEKWRAWLLLGFGLAWFVIAFVPVSNIWIQIGTVYADR
ncbi:MAG: hypothetical protein KDB07_08810, partial [Planctomycetes bacterium]|nr:hypothetical protein [Planctomycetota bacterium]